MVTQLRTVPDAVLPAIDDETVEAASGLAISFHRVEELLRHGKHDRGALMAELDAALKGERGSILAWVETRYDPRTGKPRDDAKNPLRELLAQRGVTSQFLATPDPDEADSAKRSTSRAKKRGAADATKDYAARSAAADLLLRTTGALHPELARTILGDFLERTEHSEVHLVGVHSRLQQSGVRGVPPRLVITAVSITARTDFATPWAVKMWNGVANTWTGYASGIAAFHAGPIGSKDRGRSGEKAVPTRIHVESILDALPAGPVVLFLDALATRTIWPGLQNQHFTERLLPAGNLSAQRDVAIIRCNTSREVPRPVDRSEGARPRKDHRQPAAPDRYLYRHDESGVWMFAKSSRIYRAKGGRLGAQFTPWTLPEKLRHLLDDDWHAYTGTEIAVAQAGCWSELDLATLTARLCDHTVVWDDRTLAPMPLHLATRADLTHPDYRSDDEDDDA